MPRLEPKIVQKELEQGWLWPVYWIHGQEKMKSRELLKRIRTAVLGDATPSLLGFSETVLDGHESDVEDVLEAALGQSLANVMEAGAGSPTLVVVRDANAIKNIEALGQLLRPKARRSEVGSVCVLLAKDLDARKKFSKVLLEKAAVVACEEVAEGDREAWILYLAKRRGLESSKGLPESSPQTLSKALPPSLVAELTTLDPWSLDIVDQELEKQALLSQGGALSEDSVVAGTGTSVMRGDDFIAAFFGRDLALALKGVGSFAHLADDSLPLLGLLAWNARYLALALADSGRGLRGQKINPYLGERLKSWVPIWSLEEVLELQGELAVLDHSLKQTPLLPLGAWSDLVIRFCSRSMARQS